MANKKSDKASEEKVTRKTTRVNFVLDEDTYDYIKNIGALRCGGSMTAYIESLVKADREAWSENEAALREILKRK